MITSLGIYYIALMLIRLVMIFILLMLPIVIIKRYLHL